MPQQGPTPALFANGAHAQINGDLIDLLNITRAAYAQKSRRPEAQGGAPRHDDKLTLPCRGSIAGCPAGGPPCHSSPLAPIENREEHPGRTGSPPGPGEQFCVAFRFYLADEGWGNVVLGGTEGEREAAFARVVLSGFEGSTRRYVQSPATQGKGASPGETRLCQQ